MTLDVNLSSILCTESNELFQSVTYEYEIDPAGSLISNFISSVRDEPDDDPLSYPVITMLFDDLFSDIVMGPRDLYIDNIHDVTRCYELSGQNVVLLHTLPRPILKTSGENIVRALTTIITLRSSDPKIFNTSFNSIAKDVLAGKDPVGILDTIVGSNNKYKFKSPLQILQTGVPVTLQSNLMKCTYFPRTLD